MRDGILEAESTDGFAAWVESTPANPIAANNGTFDKIDSFIMFY